MSHIMGKPMFIQQPKNGMLAHPGLFGKKQVKRDQNWRKMTQKGAIHAKNPAKQPEHYQTTNHERHQLRRIIREGRK